MTVNLMVCLFDQNCEEVPTEVILTLDNPEEMSEFVIFEAFLKLTQSSHKLRRFAHELGAYDFSQWEWRDVSFQTDTRDNVIRLRDMDDIIGEPGNIAMMVNLRMVETS